MEQLERVIASISQSIAFDSSRKAAQPGMPFGKGAYDCLCHFLSLAGEMGFSVRNYDGYAVRLKCTVCMRFIPGHCKILTH